MINTMKKSSLRKYFKQRRENALKKVESSVFTFVRKELNNLISKDKLNGTIGIYWPLPGEVDLRPLKTSLILDFALPSINSKGQMQYHQWDNSDLHKDCVNIPAPLMNPPLKAKSISLILAPAIAIDQNGIRLGYGGGYYDRLRNNKEWRSIPAFAVLPQECYTNSPLPKDPWDIAFDGWITEKGIKHLLTNTIE